MREQRNEEKNEQTNMSWDHFFGYYLCMQHHLLSWVHRFSKRRCYQRGSTGRKWLVLHPPEPLLILLFLKESRCSSCCFLAFLFRHTVTQVDLICLCRNGHPVGLALASESLPTKKLLSLPIVRVMVIEDIW